MESGKTIDELDQHRKVLNELGFDVKKDGCKYFLSATTQMQEVLELVESGAFEEFPFIPKNSERDAMIEFLHRIYVEDYGFSFECGRATYFNKMVDFVESQNFRDEEQRDYSVQVFGREPLGLDDYILKSALYLNKTDVLVPACQKTFSRNKK